MAYPRLLVEVNFDPISQPTNVFVVEDATYGALDGPGVLAAGDVWTDITSWVDGGITINRGSRTVDDPTVRYEAGSCSFVLTNTDRRFDPTNLSGPYVSAGRTLVQPMKPIRVSATWGNFTFPLFNGYIDNWDLSYTGPSWAEVQVSATDAFKLLAAYTLPEVAIPVGVNDLPGTRVNRVLNYAGWTATRRNIGAGLTPLQSTVYGTDILSELQLVADSEMGDLFIDASGVLTFRGREYIQTNQRAAVSQATFSDAAGSALDYEDAGIDYSDERIRNLILTTRVNGVQQVAEDQLSRALYQTHTYDRSDLLMTTDDAAYAYGYAILARTREPELRITELRVAGFGDDAHETAMYPHILGRDIGDQITVVKTPPGGGSPIVRNVWIRGVSHEIPSNGEVEWRTTWALQSASGYRPLILDDPDRGLLDGSNSLIF